MQDIDDCHRCTAIPAALTLWLAAVTLVGGARPMPAHAQRFENQVAVFAALDKVTARISKLEVPLDQTQEFGSLKVTPRVCYSRAPDEPPKTSTFVEVEETMLDGQKKRCSPAGCSPRAPASTPSSTRSSTSG